jgi:DnaK suppressor protein
MPKKKEMSKKKIEHFVNYFIDEKTKLLKSTLKKQDYSDLDGDEVDIVQGSLLDSMMERLSHRDQTRLDRIEEALQRLQNNTFGDCLECGEQIPVPRLMARPEATTCISCAENLERTARDYIK